jgi:hypothetical protein
LLTPADLKHVILVGLQELGHVPDLLSFPKAQQSGHRMRPDTLISALSQVGGDLNDFFMQ